MIRVILSGASGQVGRALVSAIEADADLTVAAAAAPSLGIGLADALSAGQGDVVVDFTAPEFAEPACRLCIDARVPLVLGTTGLAPERLEELGAQAAAAGVQLFHAANFAIGAVLMMQFAEQASRHLPAAEIVELHADTKKDAPSGTSLATAARMGGEVPDPQRAAAGAGGPPGGDPGRHRRDAHDPPRHQLPCRLRARRAAGGQAHPRAAARAHLGLEALL